MKISLITFLPHHIWLEHFQ